MNTTTTVPPARTRCRVPRAMHRGSQFRLGTVGLALVGAIVSGALTFHPCLGSTVIPADLSQLVKTAKVIFAGTVAETRTEWTPARTTIVTRVTFIDVRLVKGDIARSPVTLTLEGGAVGDQRIIVNGQPEFAKGGRYVLLCTDEDLGSERNSYIPILGLYQGCFEVKPDEATGRQVVHDFAGRVVTSIEGGRLVVLSRKGALGRGAKQEPKVKDIPYEVHRVNSSKKDSISTSARSAPVRTRRLGGGALPVPRSRAARPDTTHIPGWVPNSQRPAVSGTPAIRVLDAGSDPGSRMSEGEFIEAIRRLSSE